MNKIRNFFHSIKSKNPDSIFSKIFSDTLYTLFLVAVCGAIGAAIILIYVVLVGLF